jgi:hypothetical protein
MIFASEKHGSGNDGVKAGNPFEVLATNTLTDQSFIASPIAVGNDLYLRSRTHLVPHQRTVRDATE